MIKKIAIWVITPNGMKQAETLSRHLPAAEVYVFHKLGGKFGGYKSFQNLSEIVAHQFQRYTGHVFLMSTGIVVRVIAPLIKDKTVDPAVVVVDDQAHFAVSLLSGHLGGANALAREIADIVGADPVITTATDVNRLPAIDVLARELNLSIENPAAIKTVNMALLNGDRIRIYDPDGFLAGRLPNTEAWSPGDPFKSDSQDAGESLVGENAGIYLDDIAIDLPANILVLRPASLTAGIGCNRNTVMNEMKALLQQVLADHHLAPASLKALASIDLKSDEGGLRSLSENLGLPLVFFSRRELNQVKEIENPSNVVEKHVGVKSVCEAAAILAADNGALIVPKQITANVTVAIARVDFSSWASDPAAGNI